MVKNSSSSPEVVVGLLWHSVNSDNLGVTALTASNIEIIESAAKDIGCRVRFIVLGWADKGDSQIPNANLSVLPMRAKDLISPRGLFRTARQCDLILDISAGDSFSDIYGSRRFVFNLLAKLAVRLAGRPLIICPQTIGPFQRTWARWGGKAAMKTAGAVLTRDRLSTEYAVSLGTSGVIEATDVAFRLPYVKPASHAGRPVQVGINISGLLFNGGYTGKNMFQLQTDYPVLARVLIEKFKAIENCDVHLVSHVISIHHAVEDDYRVAERLAGEFPGVTVSPRFRNPSEAKSYIAGLDFFTGSRMHACIAAFSSGVPVVPIAYSRKFSGLFGSLGYDEIADCRLDSNEVVLEKVFSGFRSRQELKKKVDQGRALAEKKLGIYSDLLCREMRRLIKNDVGKSRH